MNYQEIITKIKNKGLKIKTIAPMILLVAMIVNSCGSSKSIGTESGNGGFPPQIEEQYPPEKTTKSDSTVRSRSEKEWQSLQVPLKMRMRSPKSISLSAKASFVRDEETTISFRMLGMEVACMHFDRDSIIIYEKLNHTMLAEAVPKLTQYTGFGVGEMQDLVLGTASIEGLLIIARQYLDQCDVDKSDYVTTTYGEFPSEVSLEIVKDKFKLSASFSYDYDKAKWDEKVPAFRKPDPSKYRVVKLKDLLKLFKN